MFSSSEWKYRNNCSLKESPSPKWHRFVLVQTLPCFTCIYLSSELSLINNNRAVTETRFIAVFSRVTNFYSFKLSIKHIFEIIFCSHHYKLPKSQVCSLASDVWFELYIYMCIYSVLATTLNILMFKTIWSTIVNKQHDTYLHNWLFFSILMQGVSVRNWLEKKK